MPRRSAQIKAEVPDEPMDTSGAQQKETTGWPTDELRMLSERVLNTYDTPTDFAGVPCQEFDLTAFLDAIHIDIINESKDKFELEFDLVGVEAPIANAIRRVLIAEVPTLAIEKVYLYQNTSIIQDEVLCHRFGLLPVKADPRQFNWPTEKIVGINENVDCSEEPAGEPNRNLVFDFHVKCKRNPRAVPSDTAPEALYIDSSIYSKDFKWCPIGNQAADFAADPPRMVHDDILVAKLRPGQEIEARLHCVKGVGRDHAKFSPVATASYRLLPTIRLKEPITGEAAHRLQDSFSKGVIEIKKQGGVEVAEVVDARRDTCSRNVLRHDDLAAKVELGRKKQHFIFSIESTGAMPAHELFVDACKILAAKAAYLRSMCEPKWVTI
ncbi:unnamed protein product, partial [Mesorhabditis spiculigera]